MVPDPDIRWALDAVETTYAPGNRGRKQRGGGSVQTELGSFRRFERLLTSRFFSSYDQLEEFQEAVAAGGM